jgi:serine-type D-Ala-D-Ala carboxypeptidase/endopeptidase (penicillin-binding protein 4)
MVRIAFLAALLAVLLSPAAQAAGLAGTQRALDREMRRAGPASGAYVVDLDTGRRLYARAPDVARIPASVNKLYTTAAAIRAYGRLGQLTTDVLGDTVPDEDGVVGGNLYLRGNGDPSFGPVQARGLARVLVGSGLTRVTGTVIGDESHFDALRGGPSSGYRTDYWVGPLSALAFNHGVTTDRYRRFQTDPARYAAEKFRLELRRLGVRIPLAARAGLTPSTAEPLGQWASPRMARLARATNRPSDNFYAETLLKALGADHGSGGSTAAGAAVARREAAAYGARPAIVDGSGLSRANRTTPRDVVKVLAGMAGSRRTADAMRLSLSIAGRAGTLSNRMRRTAARGRCRAKTGTIYGVSNLAGYCTSPTGHRTAFAFLMNGITVWTAQPLQDRMAAALARLR